MAEGARLESVCTVYAVPRVRIPLSPPEQKRPNCGAFFVLVECRWLRPLVRSTSKHRSRRTPEGRSRTTSGMTRSPKSEMVTIPNGIHARPPQAFLFGEVRRVRTLQIPPQRTKLQAVADRQPGSDHGCSDAAYAASATKSSTESFATAACIKGDQRPFRTPVCRSYSWRTR